MNNNMRSGVMGLIFGRFTDKHSFVEKSRAVVLEVRKTIADTYDDAAYEDEEFILLDIYPKKNGTVYVTYGGLTKVITDTSGAEEPNAQQVFFGTFTGVTDTVETPESGTLKIYGDYAAFAAGTHHVPKWGTAHFGVCIEDVIDLGSITSIPVEAFYNCAKIKNVTIPNTVKSIGNSAFYGCSGLVSVSIPDTIKSIGSQAFYGCSGLVSALIPDSVTIMGSSVFQNCSKLAEVTIPNSLTSISYSTFYNCDNLTNIAIPDSVTSISDYAFHGCSNLASINIPSSVTDIISTAFTGCVNLIDIAVSDDNEYYASEGDILFDKTKSTIYSYPSAKGTIVIPDTVARIGQYAFGNCYDLTGITIPDSITAISANAFTNSGLTSISIPDTVLTIGDSAFSGCDELTSVVLSNSLTEIGPIAFNSCDKLASIVIPDSVTTIGYNAFGACAGLTNVTFENTSSWRVKDSDENITVTVTNPTNNAALLTDKYRYYTWYRS